MRELLRKFVNADGVVVLVVVWVGVGVGMLTAPFVMTTSTQVTNWTTGPAMSDYQLGGSRVQERREHWHWYELSAIQTDHLVSAAASVVPDRRLPVTVVCDNAECLPLAEDIVDALRDAGWTANLAVSFLSRGRVGLSCNYALLCDTLTSATGIKTVPLPADEVGSDRAILVFGPKR